MEATTKDLRLHARELIAATDRGEKIVITFRGKPRAILSPFTPPSPDRSERNPAFGLWAGDGACSVEEQLRNLRKPRKFD